MPDVDLNSFGALFVRHVIENHQPVGVDNIRHMCNMRTMDVLPILAVLCDRDIAEKTEDGYIIVEN